MAVRSGKTSIGMILLVTVIGLILGSFFSVVIDAILHAFSAGSTETGNVISIFTLPITMGTPLSVGYPNPLVLDLGAVKGQFGFQLNINAMSFLGVWLSHKFYKSHQ